MLPVLHNCTKEVLSIQSLASLVWDHPQGHHELDKFQVALEAAVDGKHILEVLALWHQLTAAEDRDGVGVRP